MNKILIENYRGFDIEFDSDAEKFQCIITEDNTKESASFSAVKKFIDDYKKENIGFEPFWVVLTPSNRFSNARRLQIIGVRKDGRFVTQNEVGKKDQLSDYSLSDYMLDMPENKTILSALDELDKESNKQIIEMKNKKAELVSKLNIITLKEYKEQIK